MRVPSFSAMELFVVRLIVFILLLLAGYRFLRDDVRHTFASPPATLSSSHSTPKPPR